MAAKTTEVVVRCRLHNSGACRSCVRLFGLDILPVERKWGSGIYGSLIMGWGTTLLLASQVAFRKADRELVRALAVGLSVWLLAEPAFFHVLAHVVQRWSA
jgi:hypothetical protein